MRRNLICLGQRFVAVLILAIGLSAYGCKDTVSISEDGQVPLSSLTVTPGTLQPAFFSNTTSYIVDVSTTVSSVTVKASPKDSTTTMTINGVDSKPGQGRPVPLSPSGTTTNITIVLTNQNDIESTYDIVVRKVANNLSALSVNPGPLVPAFAASTLSYQVDVGSGVTSVTVVATKADPRAVMSGSVNAGPGVATGKAPISLDGPGTSKEISITVAVPNGEAKIYTITVNRAASSDNSLSALTVTANNVVQPLAPDFNASTLGYTVNVGLYGKRG
ncbi:MAG TPA: cadherin-like beta sandwich domain-containing protein [Nitrospira sp.]|nr:cadherin-like beta sandwich domain-containing protein [Nitrospira sp.]